MKRLLCAVVLLAACSDPTGSTGVRVRAESETIPAFRSDEVVTVRYTVTNATFTTIELSPCGERLTADVQRLEDGEWVTVGGMVCPLALLPPVELAPGESRTDSVQVTGFGTWRVHIRYARGGDATAAVSPSFQTRIPPD
jgi:hypothetical protein